MDLEKFNKDKAGDLYCETCLEGKGYRHFWNHQLSAQRKVLGLPTKLGETMTPQYTLKEIISFKLAGLPATEAGIYYRIKVESWPYSKNGSTGLYEIPGKYTKGQTLPAPIHPPGIPQDPKARGTGKKRGKLTLQSSDGKILAVVKPTPAPSPFQGIDLPLLGLVTVRLTHWESKHGVISADKRNEVTHLMYDYALKSQDHVQAIDFVLKVLS